MYKVVIKDSKCNDLKFEFDFMEDAQAFIESAFKFAEDKNLRVEITKEHIDELTTAEGSEE